MESVNPQHYKYKGQEIGIDADTLDNAVQAIRCIQSIDARLFPLLTLNHLSKETGVSYGYLRAIVARKISPYRHFLMRKKTPGRKNKRMINVPEESLLKCQKWIAQNILKFGRANPNSYAYHPESSPVFASRAHPKSQWLIKVDIHDFFHAITEHRVYDVFRSLGYSKLLSFELTRICTIACERVGKKDTSEKHDVIQYYKTPHVGILPQGAPTSPMLSNLVMRQIDESLAKLASVEKMRFSRYADDIVFSCSDKRSSKEISRIKYEILNIINKGGFKPNLRKTVMRGPGSRKIVLGMLVDSARPKLTREYKDMIRLHLYYLTHPNYGPAAHAECRKTSIAKIYHHVLGMINWARMVEPKFGSGAIKSFNNIKWPPISHSRYFE